MDFLSKIISYFATIPGYYKESVDLYAQVASTYQALSKSLDCEIFYSSSFEVLNHLKKTNLPLYQKLMKGFDPPNLNNIEENSKISEDLENFNIENVGFSLSDALDFSEFIKTEKSEFYKKKALEDYKNSDKNKTFEELAKSESKVDPCIDIKSDEENREEMLQKISETLSKDVDIEKELQKLIDNCKASNSLNINKEIEKYSEEELKKLAEDCFIPVEEQGEEPDLNEVEEDINDKESTKFDPKAKDLNADGVEQKSLSPESLKTLLDLMGEKSPCLEEVNKKIEEIKQISKEYTEHIGKKVTLEKEYAYTRLHFSMYDEIYKNYNKISASFGLGSSSNNLFTEELFEYSKEIRLIKNEKYSTSINLFDFVIHEIKEPEEGDDGDFFQPYFDMSDLLDRSPYNDGKASQEQWEAVDKYTKEKFLEMLALYETKVRSDIRSVYSDLSPTLFLSNLKEFIEFYNELKAKWLPIKDTYENFDKKSQEYTDLLKLKGQEIETLAEELGCNPINPKRVNEEELEPGDLETDGDFRGIPDPEKPTIYDPDYWRKFAKMATIVGLAPIPQFTTKNQLGVNLTDPSEPTMKLPQGGPVFDDDGIPRFMFYPIGFIIPTPVSADFIYRIPLPTIWVFLNVTTIESPLKALVEKLLEMQGLFGSFETYSRTFTKDMDMDRVWQNIPLGLMQHLISLMGLGNAGPVQLIQNQIAQLSSSFINGMNSKLQDAMNVATTVDSTDSTNSIEQEHQRFTKEIDSQMGEIREYGQRFLDRNLNSINDTITKEFKDFDLRDYSRNAEDLLQQAGNFVNLGIDLVSSVGGCVGIDYPFDFSINPNGLLGKMKNYSANFSGLLEGLAFPSFNIPFLRLSEFLTYSLSNISLDLFKQLKLGMDATLVFPLLGELLQYLTDAVMSYFYKIMRWKLWKLDFPIMDFFNFKIPESLINSLSMTLFDFPELIMVTFLGISGVIPYPYVMLINPSRKSVSGVIDERTVEFLITLDYTNPIKVIKKNFGSYTLPLRNHIEDIINSGLGLYFEPAGGNVLTLCDILSRLGFSWESILGELQNLIKWDFLPKDLWNSFELPNPNMLCKLAAAKNAKEAFNIALSEVKLNSTLTPPTIPRAADAIKYGVTDYDGAKEFVMDEFKSTFGAAKFPTTEELLNMNRSQKQLLLLNEMGIAKKVKLDLLPQLTLNSPYIQDDLPTWERLQWWNIPFILFLIEFNIAAKFGAVLPIPEVSPIAAMR